MADFRKWIIVLAAVALFAGLAGAQSSQIPFTCQATAAETPQLRSEGLTELVGDIVLTCTGGTVLPAGSQLQTANFTVYTNSTVTSRILASSGGASEALLMIDDPGNGGTNYGNTVPQTFCGSSNSIIGAGPAGCVEYVGNQGATPTAYTGGTPSFSSSNNLGVPVAGAANGGTVGANVFQGVVSGSSVTFYGVPIQPPSTSGAVRIFRITNVRINANGIGGGSLTPATANIAVTGTAAMPINNSLLTVGYISASLGSSLRNADDSGTDTPNTWANLLQCQDYGSSSNPQGIAVARFTELQGSAFKVRGTTGQNRPGQIYTNAESGFTFTGLSRTNSSTGVQNISGYADWGTRLKAVFSNVPSGVSVYVSVVNITGSGAVTPGGTTPYARMIGGETLYDTAGNAGGADPTTFLPLVAQTGTNTLHVFGSNVPFAPVVLSGGAGSAVWEIVNSNQNTPENFDFEYAIVVSHALPGVPPAPSAMKVNLSYAPTPPSFSSSSGGSASSSLGIPRFADTSTARTGLNFVICQTALLYPYVINVGGFDTGLAVANTSSDPFGTETQEGACSIYWYGANPPATNPGYLGSAGYQTTTPTTAQNIKTGTIQSWGTSVVAPNFSGYVIAVCNFQYAHGFAFVSDLGARNLAMGYLAEVLTQDYGAFRDVPDAEALVH